jgi:hypothetical protein
MPVLSIIASKMLEDELVHLLSADRAVRELLLVDRRECLSLSGKMRAQNRPTILGAMLKGTGMRKVARREFGLQRIDLQGGTGCGKRQL